MKNDFKKSFDKVKPDNASYNRMYNKIINSQKKNRSVYKYAAIAAAIIAVIVISMSFFIRDRGIDDAPDNPILTAEAINENSDENKIAYKVVLSVNPDVEFSVDENDMLLAVKGLNEDGERLIEGIDFAGLSLENGTIIVVNKLIVNGYISAYSIEREVQLYFSENSDLDALSIMGDIVNAGTAGYSLNSAETQLNEKSLSIRYWSEQGDVEVPVPAESVFKLTLDYELHDEHIDMIDVIVNDEEKLGHFIDCSGMDTDNATLYFFEELFEKGYIRDDVIIEYTFDNITDTEFDRLAELINALASYHGLKVKVVLSPEEPKILLKYDDIDIAPAENKYTIMQILSPMLIKTENDIAPVQMEILQMCFTDEELAVELEPRIFVVVPNIEGLDEDTALYLLNLAGITPRRVEEEYDSDWAPQSDNPYYDLDYLGMVVSQDITAGTTYEQGINFMYWVLVNTIDESIKNNMDSGEFSHNMFEIYGENCLSDINKVIFEVQNSGTRQMELREDFVSDFNEILSDMTFGILDTSKIEINPESEKYYITVITESNNYFVTICEWEDGYAAILEHDYINFDTEVIMDLIILCVNNVQKFDMSYNGILNEMYSRVEYAEANVPNEISAGRYFIADEKTRVDTWDSNFAEINGYSEVDIAYENVKDILNSIIQPSPISAYRSIELVGVEGGFFEGVEYTINTDFRIELVYEDYEIYMYADHSTLYIRSRIDDEWYTAMVTSACADSKKIYRDYIAMFAGEEALPICLEDLSGTTSISIYYTKQEDYKDYPANGALSEMVIEDAEIIEAIVLSVQSALTPISPYPSRENADIVFHTPNGDVWAKIKNFMNPSDADGDYKEYVLSEPAIIFSGYYWFENAELYYILFDDVG